LHEWRRRSKDLDHDAGRNIQPALFRQPGECQQQPHHQASGQGCAGENEGVAKADQQKATFRKNR